MLSAIKKMLPPGARAVLAQWKFKYDVRRLEGEWTRCVAATKPADASGKLDRVLLIPSDARTLFGALGDEAMIGASEQMAWAVNPGVEIHVVIDGPEASRLAAAKGYKPHDVWLKPDFPAQIGRLVSDLRIDALLIVGADVMDGYYSGMVPAKMLAAADIAARLGVRVSVLGFSFNDHPVPELARAFDRVSERVKLNLRDEISLDRFQRFSKAKAALVADSAFCLAPGPVDAPADAWVGERRAAGERVVGFNIHPMLFKGATDEQVELIIKRSADAIRTAAQQRAVSWLMLPHDYRGAIGDARCLKPIFDTLKPELGERIRFFEGIRHADELKAMAGQLDGVVTGRMHLAIGTLGTGRPTMCLTYQDKFEGLFRHFGLPDWLLLDPKKLELDGELSSRLIRFCDELDPLTVQVRSKLPDVLQLSRNNFAVLDQS